MYVGGAVADLDVLCPLLRFGSALDAHYLRLEEELHAEQVLDFDLSGRLRSVFPFGLGGRVEDIVTVGKHFVVEGMYLALRMLVDAFERDELLFGLVVEYQFEQLLVDIYLLEQFLAVVLETVIADEGLLDRPVLLRDELANRHRHALLLRSRPPAVQLYVKRADHRLQVADAVLFLLDGDAEAGDFLLHALDLLGVFLVLLFQLLEEVVRLLFEVLHHELLLLLGVDDEVLVAVGLESIRDEVVVVGHGIELKLYLLDVLLQRHHHVLDLLLRPRLLLQHRQAHLDRHVVGVVIRDELQLVAMHPQGLDLALLPLQC